MKHFTKMSHISLMVNPKAISTGEGHDFMFRAKHHIAGSDVAVLVDHRSYRNRSRACAASDVRACKTAGWRSSLWSTDTARMTTRSPPPWSFSCMSTVRAAAGALTRPPWRRSSPAPLSRPESSWALYAVLDLERGLDALIAEGVPTRCRGRASRRIPADGAAVTAPSNLHTHTRTQLCATVAHGPSGMKSHACHLQGAIARVPCARVHTRQR